MFTAIRLSACVLTVRVLCRAASLPLASPDTGHARSTWVLAMTLTAALASAAVSALLVRRRVRQSFCSQQAAEGSPERTRQQSPGSKEPFDADEDAGTFRASA